MKRQLLPLPSVDFSPFDALLAEILSYAQTKGGLAGFADCIDITSISYEAKSSFIKTGCNLSHCSDPQCASGTVAGAGLNFHSIVKLNT